MKRHKGYRKDVHHISYKTEVQDNSYASGTNKTPEQILAKIDSIYDNDVEETKRCYARIAKMTNLTVDELRKYCRDRRMWEVKFDSNGNLIPLEDALANLEEQRERTKARRSYDYVKRIVNKDNQKFVYNSGGRSGGSNRVRIPSLKRSKVTWKRFYELFPYYKENYAKLNNKNGIKLKKVW